MGSYTYDDLPPLNNPPLIGWGAVFAKDLGDFGDLAQIIIPSLDTTTRWENCRWQARNETDLPQRGDECLAIFDENNQIWIPIWWPF